VLASTVGLIRSEAASDLRILTAAGASSTHRRALAAATAGSWLLGGRQPPAISRKPLE